MVGPGKPIDTDRFFVICSNVVGGCMGTTGPASIDPGDRPPYALDFPGRDHPRHGARAGHADRPPRHRHAVLRGRRLDGRHAGAAMGGELSASASSAAMPIATAAKHSAQNIAFHEVGRQAIMADPDWRGGRYIEEGTRPEKGLAVARMARAHHLPVRAGPAPEVRPQAAGPRRADLLVRRRLPDRELPALPGPLLRRALRRQLLSLPHPRDGLFRPRRRLWRRRSPRPSRDPRPGSAWSRSRPTGCSRPPIRAPSCMRSTPPAPRSSFVEIETDKGHDAFLLDVPEMFATDARLHRRGARARGPPGR